MFEDPSAAPLFCAARRNAPEWPLADKRGVPPISCCQSKQMGAYRACRHGLLVLFRKHVFVSERRAHGPSAGSRGVSAQEFSWPTGGAGQPDVLIKLAAQADRVLGH